MTWQPIETAPKDGTRILVCLQVGAPFIQIAWYEHSYRVVNGQMFALRIGWRNDLSEHEIYPLHWMPLPKPITPAKPQEAA